MILPAVGGVAEGPILLVDDSPTILAVMKDILTRLNLRAEAIQMYSSEDDALSAIETSPPALAFVDMDIGQGKGETVMLAILKKKPLARVILMTGLAREDPRVVEAVSHGAFAYLRKPLRREAVQKILLEITSEGGGYERIM